MTITIPLLFYLCALICELIATFSKNQRIGWMTFGFSFVIAAWIATGVLTVAVK